MRRLIIAAALLGAVPAVAQAPPPAGDVVPMPMSAQERAAILSMCPAAVWAQRQQFDGMCDYFKNKFETAEREAKAAAEKSAPKKD